MKITGHKTESIYRRYAIECDEDLREAKRKLTGAILGTDIPSFLPRLTLTAKCAKKQQGWRSSMAEQWFCKPQVGGSIPLASSST